MPSLQARTGNTGTPMAPEERAALLAEFPLGLIGPDPIAEAVCTCLTVRVTGLAGRYSMSAQASFAGFSVGYWGHGPNSGHKSRVC